MDKFRNWSIDLIAVISVILCIWLASFGGNAQAQVLDAITGHIADFKSRSLADKEIGGVVIKSGEIDIYAKGQDLIHYSSGTITIREVGGKRYLQLEKNFKAGYAPDLHVYVSKRINIKDNEDFVASEQVELGRLIKGNGASYYELPKDIEFNSATIWCKRFREYIGSANLVQNK